MPVYATLFMIIMLASLGLPLLNGFVGEFTILVGAFLANWRWALFAGVGVILGAAYLLWLYQRVFFGELKHEENKSLQDVNLREVLTLAPLIVACVWIGVYPKPFFEMTAPASAKIVAAVETARAAAAPAAAAALPAVAVCAPAPAPVAAAAIAAVPVAVVKGN
jgi:NADH-quinone oxidoreductase subunit M